MTSTNSPTKWDSEGPIVTIHSHTANNKWLIRADYYTQSIITQSPLNNFCFSKIMTNQVTYSKPWEVYSSSIKILCGFWHPQIIHLNQALTLKDYLYNWRLIFFNALEAHYWMWTCSNLHVHSVAEVSQVTYIWIKKVFMCDVVLKTKQKLMNWVFYFILKTSISPRWQHFLINWKTAFLNTVAHLAIIWSGHVWIS